MRDLLPPSRTDAKRTLVEEMACAIAEAQAALFAGRFRDLEECTRRQQEICLALEEFRARADPLLATSAAETSAESGAVTKLVTMAERTREHNRLFGSVLRRMRRHLETLRSVLGGPSSSYRPGAPTTPGQEG